MVAEAACDSDAAEGSCSHSAEGGGVGGGDDFRQVDLVGVEIEEGQDGGVVGEVVKVHKHGSGGVCCICEMNFFILAIEVEEKPGVNGSEGKTASIVSFLYVRYISKHPCQLQRGRVGGDGQAADILELVCTWPLLELSDDGLRSCVWPSYGIAEKLACFTVPQHCRLALRREANSFDIGD